MFKTQMIQANELVLNFENWDFEFVWDLFLRNASRDVRPSLTEALVRRMEISNFRSDYGRSKIYQK
jgi:hypothetical protein